jgi:hypothetical protein
MKRKNTYLLRNPILVQDISNNQGDICSGVMPLQQCKGKLVFFKSPLIWLANWTVDIVGGNRYIGIAASALRSPDVEGERDLAFNTL